jgi:hypothetical protein
MIISGWCLIFLYTHLLIFSRFIGCYGGEGGVLYWTSFFNLVEVGGASFCFPCCGRSGSADVRSTSSIRQCGGSATLALAAISKVWSYASVMACGCRSHQASSLLAVSRRRDGWELRLVKRSSGGPLCACVRNPCFSMGLLVKWVCTVLLSAI